MGKGSTKIPNINLNLNAILLKADSSPHARTYQSDLSGVAYAASRDGGILLLDHHGFFGKTLEDWRVIHQELGYIIEDVERWQQ